MDSLGNVEIFLELGFITPYKNKYLSPLDEDSDYFWPYINDLYDLKDYILIITKDFGRFIINKETKEIKRYTAKGYDSANMKTPLGIKIVGLHQNFVIEYTDQINAGNHLDYITDEYQPDVASFYKKAAENENATLVLYEIGK